MKSTSLSNWGRWGKDDQRGALNLLTPEVIRNALGLVKEGRLYNLSVETGPNGPAPAHRNQTWHVCRVYHDLGRPGRDVGEDFISMHVHTGTHLDALGHVWYDHQLYNGYSDSSISLIDGARKNSVENVKGIVGRGVMLDVPAYKGLPELPLGYAITPADLEGCASRQGVAFRPGDILLVRTGFLKEFVKDRSLYDKGIPGVGESCIEWLHRHDVVALGVDNPAVECRPSETPGGALRLHEVMLRDLGAYLIEYAWLEELARDKVYEFLFVAAPLQIKNGASSPMNPLAIV